MQIESLLARCCGFEDDGENIRFFVTSPDAERPVNSEGIRTQLFHLIAGNEAEAVRQYLAAHPAWEFLRVRPAAPGEVAGQKHADRRKKYR